jgi:hypothetical protein
MRICSWLTVAMESRNLGLLMRRFIRIFLWILAIAIPLGLVNVFTIGEVPYRMHATVQVTLHDSDGRPIPEAMVEIDWMEEQKSGEISFLRPTRVASGASDDVGMLALAIDIPGTIREGLLERGMRWLGEDGIRRKAAVRGVLKRTRVQVQKAGWLSLTAFLDKAVVTG